MPIEIRELVIKASVTEGSQGQNPSQGSNSDNQDLSDLITACVDQVLAILKEKSER